jgi:hypothetical protein
MKSIIDITKMLTQNNFIKLQGIVLVSFLAALLLDHNLKHISNTLSAEIRFFKKYPSYFVPFALSGFTLYNNRLS